MVPIQQPKVALQHPTWGGVSTPTPGAKAPLPPRSTVTTSNPALIAEQGGSHPPDRDDPEDEDKRGGSHGPSAALAPSSDHQKHGGKADPDAGTRPSQHRRKVRPEPPDFVDMRHERNVDHHC